MGVYFKDGRKIPNNHRQTIKTQRNVGWSISGPSRERGCSKKIIKKMIIYDKSISERDSLLSPWDWLVLRLLKK